MIFGFSMPPQSVIFTAGEQQILYTFDSFKVFSIQIESVKLKCILLDLRFRRKLKCRHATFIHIHIYTNTYWFFVHNLSRNQVSAGTLKHTYQKATNCSMPLKIGRGLQLLLDFCLAKCISFLYYLFVVTILSTTTTHLIMRSVTDRVSCCKDRETSALKKDRNK